jgi:hypothetical protein
MPAIVAGIEPAACSGAQGAWIPGKARDDFAA